MDCPNQPAVNKQISEMIFTPGNDVITDTTPRTTLIYDAILVAYRTRRNFRVA